MNKYYSNLVSYFRLKLSTTEPSMLTFSDVCRIAGLLPPMRYTPDAVSQDTWAFLASLSVWDWFQVPEAGLHLTHEVRVVEVGYPPQASPPSWLWRLLASGNWGSEQIVFVIGLKISAGLILRLPSLYPPVNKTTETTKKLSSSGPLRLTQALSGSLRLSQALTLWLWLWLWAWSWH